MKTYPSTPIAYASYPHTGVVRTDRKFRATIQFYTGSAWGRGTWACSKTFNDESHLDNFVAYMKRKKGWNVDELWYSKNVEPMGSNTFEFIYYNAIDKDDWSRGKVNAMSLDEAIRKAERRLEMTGMKLKKNSFKVVQ